MARMSLPTPTLRTARLLLRPFTSADADALFALHSSAYVLRYWDGGILTTAARRWDESRLKIHFRGGTVQPRGQPLRGSHGFHPGDRDHNHPA